MNHETVLPKNVRQIGEIQQDKKVYLEDYVTTFIKRKEKEAEAAGKSCLGILVGSLEQEEEGSLVFVRGALLLEAGEEADKAWKLTEEEKEKNFPDTRVVGCFMTGAPDEAGSKEMISLLPEQPLLIFHIQEGEETVYWFWENQYQKLKGYFIFYERNPQMQKYMADHCSPRKVEKEDGKEDGAIASFRKKVAQKDRIGKAGGTRYLASSFLVLTIFVLGMTILNNYDKMKQIEEAMSRMTVEMSEPSQAVPAETDGAESVSAQTVSAAAENPEEAEANIEEGGQEEATEEAAEAAAREEWETQGEEEQETEQETESQTAAEADLTDASSSHILQERNYSLEDPEEALEMEALGKTDEILEAASRQSQPVYTIRYGDTLADISARYYGSLDKVEEICELNGIDDANLIVPGEKIVLP